MLGIADAMTDRFGDEPFDISPRQRCHTTEKMLIADLESTIIEQECLDELAKTIGKEGVIADITARAMRSRVDFEPALKERVAMLQDLPESALKELYDYRHLTHARGDDFARHFTQTYSVLRPCFRRFLRFLLRALPISSISIAFNAMI